MKDEFTRPIRDYAGVVSGGQRARKVDVGIGCRKLCTVPDPHITVIPRISSSHCFSKLRLHDIPPARRRRAFSTGHL